jgi:hypothetical protein
VHLDADAGFVVCDDIDLTADQTDLQPGDVLDVDDAFFAGGDEPLLGNVCFSWFEGTRYIVCGKSNTIYLDLVKSVR